MASRIDGRSAVIADSIRWCVRVSQQSCLLYLDEITYTR
jgi:hypothetical protein